MPEVIVNLEYVVTDRIGREYYVNVVADQIAAAEWHGWLEFLPLDDSDPLLTDTETTQPTRSDLERWATMLREPYVQGAFARATRQEGIRNRRITTFPHDVVMLETAAVLDPFEALRLGKDVLRTQFRPLTRAELLTIIEQYNLNPARVSLARLSTSQLITFIVTATETQVLQGRS